ncbi:MAG: anti-sigma factor antagonist, partial [Oligoflexia bacterium]|nr:anti-sigma factor antagonist [Oligoflexia bacterium]
MQEISINNKENQKNKIFKYQILEKIEKSLLIVSFSGIMSEKANTIINQCQRELNNMDARFIILDFNDVTYLNEEVMGSIRGLQSAIRKKNATIRVCCLR